MISMVGNPRNILMTADTMGGVWNYSLQLSRALAKYDITVHLATMGNAPSNEQMKETAFIDNLKIYPSSYQLEWMDDPWQDVAAAGEWLLDLAADINPDLIHLNNYVHGNLPWPAPVLMVAHSDVLSWWQQVKKEEAPVRYQVYQEKVKEGIMGADFLVAPSQAMLNYINYFYPNQTPARVIPNGIAADGWRQESKEPYIFSMGRVWDESKNLLMLSEAAVELDWPLQIAGNNLHPATGKPVELNNVNFLGQLNAIQVQQKLASSSIYVLPVKYEPFGLSILEAAMSGSALVISDIDSLRENWDDAAIFINPEDTGNMIKAVNQFIDNQEMLLQYQEKAKHRALKFTAGHMAENYVQQYKILNLNQKEAVL